MIAKDKVSPVDLEDELSEVPPPLPSAPDPMTMSGEKGSSKYAFMQSVMTEDDMEVSDFIGDLDARIEAYCEDPSIYSIVVFSSRIKISQCLALACTIILQTAIPWVVITATWPDIKKKYDIDDAFYNDVFPCPNVAAWDVKLATAVVSWYLTSTLVSALKRSYAMAVIHCSMERSLSLSTAVLLSFSLVSTMFTTYCLFLNSPDVTDILTNCVAVNFIPDADVSFTSTVQCVSSLKRIARFSEGWIESEERRCFIQWADLPLRERLKARPSMELTRWVLDLFQLFVCGMPVLTSLCI